MHLPAPKVWGNKQNSNTFQASEVFTQSIGGELANKVRKTMQDIDYGADWVNRMVAGLRKTIEDLKKENQELKKKLAVKEQGNG